MSWQVIRQPRATGFTVIAQWKGETKRKSITLGAVEGATADLTAKLRRVDPEGTLADEVVSRIVRARSDEEVVEILALERRGERFARQAQRGIGSTFAERYPEVPAPPEEKEERGTPLNEYGAMTLRRYHDEVWWPLRIEEVADTTIEAESKKWTTILEHLGNVRCCDLTGRKWGAFLKARTTWGPTSRRLAQNAYRVALTHLVDELEGIEGVHFFRPVRGTGKAAREGRALTDDQVVALLDAAASDAHRALYATLFAVGLRPGEAYSLDWSDWTLDASTPMLHPKAARKNSEAPKPVPLSAFAVREVGAYWRSLGSPTSGPCWVYRGRPLRKPFHGFAACAKRAGIPGKVRPYDGRHTFCTNLANAGVSRPDARRLMRHATSSVIMERVYQHVDAEQVAPAVATLTDPVAKRGLKVVEGGKKGGGAR